MNEITNHKLQMTNLEFKVFRVCTGKLPIVGNIEKWLDNKTYIVLLQNNRELRPTGGFMGSYARIRVDKAGVKNIEVEDIYQPDGQLPGHVEPPYPIQEAFGQGWWKLRDSNWDPDFAAAAAAIGWFMEQGGEKQIDGIAAINLGLVEKWLKVMDGVKPETYLETITAKNLADKAESYAQDNFIPGSTQKRDFLGAVGTALVEKTKGMSAGQAGRLVKVIWEELNRGQIWVWAKDGQTEKEMQSLGWDGELGMAAENGDYVYIVESNLGSNKSNCCVSRTVKQEIDKYREKLTVKWQNPGNENYVDYVRVIVPQRYKVQDVRVQDKELSLATENEFMVPNSLRQGRSEGKYVIEKRGELQIIGFWAVMVGKTDLAAVINFEGETGKTVRVRRQPGIENFGYQLVIDGESKINTVIDRDREFKF